MRVNIKTKGPVKDNDVKALLLIKEALRISSPHMRKANVEFVTKGLLINLKP